MVVLKDKNKIRILKMANFHREHFTKSGDARHALVKTESFSSSCYKTQTDSAICGAKQHVSYCKKRMSAKKGYLHLDLHSIPADLRVKQRCALLSTLCICTNKKFNQKRIQHCLNKLIQKYRYTHEPTVTETKLYLKE
jgi:hypothetical protein